MSTRILLVGVANSGGERWTKMGALDELAALTKTAGGEVVERLLQIRQRFEPATLVGKGKALEIRDICQTYGIELVVFDNDLTPTQLRNLEHIIGVRVIDRTAVILDIFAINARTAEAKVQVELAQLEYIKNRLTGRGVEMSRLGGGIGTRGPGETQLEVDRRRIERRITSLRRRLLEIERERMVQRKRRANVFQFALAGYTNVGKSTLFNRLTDAQVKVSDQLFATLDASTRVVHLAKGVEAVLTDTVGFIRNLPPALVASFRSTLAEIRDADVVIHVADASDPFVEQRIDTVSETLDLIGARNIPVLLVFNKIDRVFDETKLVRLKERYTEAVFVSAHTGEGIEKLLQRLLGFIYQRMARGTFIIPSSRLDLIARALNSGLVLKDQEIDGKRRITIRALPVQLARLRNLIKQKTR